MSATQIHTGLIEGLAAGQLNAPLRLLARTYVETNAGAAAALDDLDTAGGAFLMSETPARMADNSLETALALIDALESGSGEAAGLKPANRQAAVSGAHKALNELAWLPEHLRDQVLEHGARWKFAAPGVRRINLLAEDGAKAELLRIEPGHGSPSHTHEGREFTLVLTGAFHDGHARYEAGDLCETGPDLTHKPIAELGEVCYALAVTEGALKFKGPLGAVQRLFGG
tara:strand:+ start:1249 stop:1932 length:684 start_codon:yes stop_codon:yes gene_type:complete